MTSVLQNWLMEVPIRMQSTLILGLRGPDTHSAPSVKAVCRWLRGLAFKPGNPDNVAEFMKAELPERIIEKGPTAKELEFCSQHFYSHLMHALEVIDREAEQKHALLAQILDLEVTRDEPKQRLTEAESSRDLWRLAAEKEEALRKAAESRAASLSAEIQRLTIEQAE